MAKVSLRIYNREIENLVDSGQLDEAIAHCRHILNTFPKHLETYRMLGKAYLEAKRYDEATDIFERVLMAVPDDFVAHVGMSIIRDEQKNMDAAIWHMQRAFEVQPSNSAIQAELQRLYGRRDGIEPPKIRLTHGALAHMYVQGELYPQAISEINGVLDEDSERQDMQVLLARAYFHAGQKSEAAEMCSQLLRRYPYCFDANRVLVELLPQTEQAENVQTYRKRIHELDPYIAFVSGSVFHTDEVPDAAVSLERLEWDGQPVDMGPEWGESRGIELGEKPAAGDEEPDWLKTAMTSESPDDSGVAASPQGEEPASASEGLPVPTPSEGGDDDIPEFLRAAGWGEDTGTFQEGQSSFDDSDESSEDLPLAEGDLPDWVKAMAPEGADTEDLTSQAESEEDLIQDDVPDWLQGIGEDESTPSEEQPLAEGELPDWLEAEKPAEEPTPEQQSQEQPMADLNTEDDIPDWLKAVQSDEEQQVAPQEPAQESQQEPIQDAPELSDESLSDWQIGDEATAEEPVDFDKIDTGELGTSASEQDDAIAWLEGLASKHGAKPEELVTDPNARTETEPDWIQKAKATKDQVDVEEPVSQEQPPAESPADLPDFLAGEEQVTLDESAADVGEPVSQEQPPAEPGTDLPQTEEPGETAEEPTADISGLGTSAEEQDDAVAWLESLASKHGAKPEELVTDPEARTETEPEWVQKAKATKEQVDAVEPASQDLPPADLPDFVAGESAEPDEEPAPDVGEPALQEQPPAETAADMPDFLAEKPAEMEDEAATDISDLGTSEEEQDDAVAWLESLASKHGAKPEELVTDPEARKDTAPDWVQKATETSPEHATGERPTAPPPEELEDLAESILDEQEEAVEEGEAQSAEMEEAQPKEPAPSAEVDETGIWLQELDEEDSITEDQEPVDEAETSPATDEDVPDWLREMEGDVAETESAPSSADETPLPDWLSDMDSDTSEPEVVTTPSSEEAESEPEHEPIAKININTASVEELAELPGIGDLLAQNIVAQRETYGGFSSLEDLSDVAGIGPSTIDDLRGYVDLEPQSDITDWLRNVEAETEAETGELAEEASADDLPSWLADLDQKPEQSQPAPGSDEDLPDWLRAEAEGESAQAEPTSPADWKPADAAEPAQEEISAPETETEAKAEETAPAPEPQAEEPVDQVVPASEPEPEAEDETTQAAPPPAPEPESEAEPELQQERPAYQEPVTRSRTGMTGMLSSVQDPMLTEAQNELTRGDIPNAMESYSKLIKKGKMLEEIIFDLREALYRYPVEVIILQTLGDAYMRANRLQEALDAYTKAEELLR